MVERLSLAILVGSILVQLVTGFLNVLNWYPFPWDFVSVHHYLAYVVVGSVLLHVGVKLPDIRYGLQTKLAEGDVLTEIPWNENPESHSNAGDLPAPVTPGISRRGVLTATGAGIGAGRGHLDRAGADPAGTDRAAGRPATQQGPAGGSGQPDRRGG